MEATLFYGLSIVCDHMLKVGIKAQCIPYKLLVEFHAIVLTILLWHSGDFEVKSSMVKVTALWKALSHLSTEYMDVFTKHIAIFKVMGSKVKVTDIFQKRTFTMEAHQSMVRCQRRPRSYCS